MHHLKGDVIAIAPNVTEKKAVCKPGYTSEVYPRFVSHIWNKVFYPAASDGITKGSFLQ